MVKIMKQGKAVIVLAGRYAGKKGVIVKAFDEGQGNKQYGLALVAGIERYPRPIKQRHSKLKRERRCRIKPFLKMVNYNHLLPTRYQVDFKFENSVTSKEVSKDQSKKRRAKHAIKAAFEERHKTGKDKWFFSKLRY